MGQIVGTNATLSRHGLLHRYIQHVYNWVIKKYLKKRKEKDREDNVSR